MLRSEVDRPPTPWDGPWSWGPRRRHDRTVVVIVSVVVEVLMLVIVVMVIVVMVIVVMVVTAGRMVMAVATGVDMGGPSPWAWGREGTQHPGRHQGDRPEDQDGDVLSARVESELRGDRACSGFDGRSYPTGDRRGDVPRRGGGDRAACSDRGVRNHRMRTSRPRSGRAHAVPAPTLATSCGQADATAIIRIRSACGGGVRPGVSDAVRLPTIRHAVSPGATARGDLLVAVHRRRLRAGAVRARKRPSWSL